jgi:hypothetical protein
MSLPEAARVVKLVGAWRLTEASVNADVAGLASGTTERPDHLGAERG